MPCRLALLCIMIGVCFGCEHKTAPDNHPEQGVTTHFARDGLTDVIHIDDITTDSLAIELQTDDATCVALTSLVDVRGREWIDHRGAGPSCRDCQMRTSIIRGQGVFSLPAVEGFDPEGGVTVRFGLMACDTLTPIEHTETDADTTLSVTWSQRDVPKRGIVSVRLILSPYSMLVDRPALQEALIANVSRAYASSMIDIQLVETITSADAPESVVFSEYDTRVLDALRDGTPQTQHDAIDIVFAGCLLYQNPFFGARSPVDGYTSRVGVGKKDAIYMPGRLCDSAGEAPTQWPLEPYSRVLAHELGHALGLYHTVEKDGHTDKLNDTDEANIMHHNPTQTTAHFTPIQAYIMRAHPWVEASYE